MRRYAGFRDTMSLEFVGILHRNVVVLLDKDGLINWADEYTWGPFLKVDRWEAGRA